MFEENRIIIVQVKLQLWLPHYNICMVSNCNGPLKHKWEWGNLIRFELKLFSKKQIGLLDSLTSKHLNAISCGLLYIYIYDSFLFLINSELFKKSYIF